MLPLSSRGGGEVRPLGRANKKNFFYVFPYLVLRPLRLMKHFSRSYVIMSQKLLFVIPEKISFLKALPIFNFHNMQVMIVKLGSYTAQF